MKKVSRLINIILFLVFVAVSIYLFIRPVDGSGAAQSSSLKLVTFIVWLVFYLLILICQGVYYLIERLVRENGRAD